MPAVTLGVFHTITDPKTLQDPLISDVNILEAMCLEVTYLVCA